MGMQMYFVIFKDAYSDDISREVQRFVRQRGGFILMVTRNGPLVGLEEAQVGAVAKHPQVRFVGPVMLNPRGFAAYHLQRIFAENLSKQLQLPDQDNKEVTE